MKRGYQKGIHPANLPGQKEAVLESRAASQQQFCIPCLASGSQFKTKLMMLFPKQGTRSAVAEGARCVVALRQQHKLSPVLPSLSQHIPGSEFPAQCRGCGIWAGPGRGKANLGRGEEGSDVWRQQKGVVDFGLDL